MPKDDKLLSLLEDRSILLDAYAASSVYVMQKAFKNIKRLQAFKDRTDLAPSLLKKIRNLTRKLRDPIILGAHLYALEITMARREILQATILVLKQPAHRYDPLIGQIAGHIGKRLLRPPFADYLKPDELEDIFKNLQREEGNL